MHEIPAEIGDERDTGVFPSRGVVVLVVVEVMVAVLVMGSVVVAAVPAVVAGADVVVDVAAAVAADDAVQVGDFPCRPGRRRHHSSLPKAWTDASTCQIAITRIFLSMSYYSQRITR